MRQRLRQQHEVPTFSQVFLLGHQRLVWLLLLGCSQVCAVVEAECVFLGLALALLLALLLRLDEPGRLHLRDLVRRERGQPRFHGRRGVALELFRAADRLRFQPAVHLTWMEVAWLVSPPNVTVPGPRSTLCRAA